MSCKCWAEPDPPRWTADERRAAVVGTDAELLLGSGTHISVTQALADHLNATGWEPPAPEPVRPTLQDFLDRYDDSVYAPDLTDWLAEHGYRVVDVQALDDAVDWLRDWAAVGNTDARVLLDALEAPRG